MKYVDLISSEIVIASIIWCFYAMIVEWWLALILTIITVILHGVYTHMLSQVKNETSKM